MSIDNPATHLPPSTSTPVHRKKKTRRIPMRPSPTLLLLTLALLPISLGEPDCVRFADYNNINQAFTDGGPGTKVFLCPSTTYRLTGTVVFTAADQELATLGYPTGSERATLLVNGNFATAIQGDCRRCARVRISSLTLDGNRGRLGRMVDSTSATGLVVLGGNEGQSISQCRIKDPRGFTAIHIREGDSLQCKGAIVEKNEIGPVGEEYNPVVDGDDPETSPSGRPLADGVSIACKDSIVRDNTFFDNTDAAVVVYCSPGSLIHANHITARSRSAMAGILLVDSTPFQGDYRRTTVKGNIIDAASRIIRVGIGLGAAVWSDDTETILRGGNVVANVLRGKYMGYGIAAAGLDGWTVKDNWDEAIHSGQRSARCFDESINPDPMGFLLYGNTIQNSEFQPGFVDQAFEYVVCIDETEDQSNNDHALPPRPGHDRQNKPKAPGSVDGVHKGQTIVKAPSIPEGFSTGSDVMDDILEHSQQRMLEAIDVLAARVDLLALTAQPGLGVDIVTKDEPATSPQMIAALAELEIRFAAIESRQRGILDIAQSLRSIAKSWDSEMASIHDWQDEIILDIQHRLNLYLAPSSHIHLEPDHLDADHDHDDGHVERSSLQSLSDRARLLGGLTDGSSWIPALRLIIAQGVFVLVVWVGRRWWKSSKHGKVL